MVSFLFLSVSLTFFFQKIFEKKDPCLKCDGSSVAADVENCAKATHAKLYEDPEEAGSYLIT
jgi:hypothetical protein